MANGAPREGALPEHVRGMPVQVQIAVLYERVANVQDDVKGLKTIILGGIATLVTGIVLGAIAVGAGWLGPHAVAAAWRFLT